MKQDYYIWKDQPNDHISTDGSAWEFDPAVILLHFFEVRNMDLNWENETRRFMT